MSLPLLGTLIGFTIIALLLGIPLVLPLTLMLPQECLASQSESDAAWEAKLASAKVWV